jgi:hypothetical protein
MAGEAVRNAPGPASARARAYPLGRDGARDALLVAAAQAGGEPWRAELDTIARWEIPAMPFTGEDAARIGVSPGPMMGRVLSEAERLWIVADFPADAAARARLLEDARTRSAPTG